MSHAARYTAVAVAAFLIGGVAFLLVARAEKGEPAQKAKAITVRQFAIEGMMCQGCVDTITSALTAVPGVESANVSLADRKAVVSADPAGTPTEKIVAAVEAVGYKARLMSSAETPNTVAAKAPILVNITRGKDDLHAVSMALALAQSARKGNRPTVVFLNVAAPVFAAKGLSGETQYADFPPIGQMLADFVAAGGKVLVCGHWRTSPGWDSRT